MEITKKPENDKLCIAVEGRLDTVTSPQLEDEIRSSLDGVNELILDFENLDYISSAGLRVVLVAQKLMDAKANGSLKVVNLGEVVKDVFDVTGFSDIITIE